MRPIQHFRANFTPDEVIDTASDNQTAYTIGATELHETDSNVRNLCFIWEDGRRVFFNYAYLISVDMLLTDPLNEMTLYFSGHVVTLKGYQLGSLFDSLFDHSLKTIIGSNLRYCMSPETQSSLVIEIHVKSE